MIDHIGMSVTDVAKSKAFYRSALAPLGYAVIMEFANDVGFGVPPKPDFWIGPTGDDVQPTHIAFRADNRKQVDAFYKAAMAAGGRDNGPPGLRSSSARRTASPRLASIVAAVRRPLCWMRRTCPVGLRTSGARPSTPTTR